MRVASSLIIISGLFYYIHIYICIYVIWLLLLALGLYCAFTLDSLKKFFGKIRRTTYSSETVDFPRQTRPTHTKYKNTSEFF